MSIHDTDLSDLDPTEADLLAAEADEDDDLDTDEDSDDLDFDSNYSDDRYTTGRNGMPSWSLFAN